jgi:hypothetical protein
MKSGIGVKVGCESKTSCDQYLTHITVFFILGHRHGRYSAAAASTAVAATRSRRLDRGPLSDSSGAEPGSLAEAAKPVS